VERVYGNSVAHWRAARARLLPDTRLAHTFSNEVLADILL
jgi:hypothetical protein